MKENKLICETLQGSGVIKLKSSKQGLRNIHNTENQRVQTGHQRDY